MSKCAAPMPPASGTLLARMTTLARLVERLPLGEPRRLLLERLMRQMLLFSRMADRLGIAEPDTPLMRAVLREVELGCLDCTAWRQCRRWLNGRSPDEDYAEFCPNEGLFSVLPRQDNVKRPYSPE